MKRMASIMFAALAAFSGLAAETAWIGGASGDWHDAANWSAGIPGSQDMAYITTPATVTVSQDAEVKTLVVTAPAVVTVGTGAELFLNNSGGPIVEAVENLVLNGAGTVRLSAGPGDNPADIRPSWSKTVRIDAKIVSEGGLENNFSGTLLVTNPDNDIPGDVMISDNGGLIEFSDVGALGYGANLIWYTRWPQFRYTGGDATLNHNFIIRTLSGDGRDVTFQHAGTGTLTITGEIFGNAVEKALCFQVDRPDATIVMNGDVRNGDGPLWYIKNGAGTLINNGTLSHSGETHTRNSGTFILANSAAAAGSAVIVGAFSTYILRDGAIMGNGTVYLEANDGIFPAGSLLVRGNSQTGTGALMMGRGSLLSVDGGAVLNNASISADTYTAPSLIKPTRIILNEDGAATWAQTIPSVTVTSGGPMLFDLKPAASGTGTLTLNDLTITDGAAIDFAAPAIGTVATRVFIGNFNDGPLPANITVNGVPAAYDSLGDGLIPDPPATASYTGLTEDGIPVSGHAIESTADAATINQSGSGGDLTLDGGAATVGALVQNWAGDPASVDLGGGTLTTPILAVAPGGNALALANGTVTAPGGTATLTLDNRSSGAPLTLAASIADNGAALALVKAGIGTASVTAPQHTGGTAILGGTLAVEVGGGASATFGPVTGAAGTALVKTGGGTLDMAASPAFAGAVIVSNGTLRAGVTGALGSAAAGTTILPGGQLDIGGAYHGQELITFAGDGPDGAGAIVSSAVNYNALMNGRLAADATIGILDHDYARFDFRGGTFDFAGHTLAKTGPGMLGFTWMNIEGVTDSAAIDIREGAVTFEENNDLQGSTNNIITIRDGAALDVYNWQYPLKWTVKVPDASTGILQIREGGDAMRNIFAGPIEVPASSSLLVSHIGWRLSTFLAPITGGGSFSRVNGQGETFLLATNDVSSVSVNAGGVHAAHPGSLGPRALDTDGAVENNAWLYLYTGDGFGTWTAADIAALAAKAAHPADATFSVWSADGSTPLDFAADFTRTANWRFRGNTHRTFTGALLHGTDPDNGAIIMQGGTAVFSNDTTPQYPGHLSIIDGAAVWFTNAAPVEYITRGNADIIIGNGGSLTLGGNTSLRGPFRYRNWSGAICGDGKATITVRDNASLSAHIYLGDGPNADMALYLDGGLFDNTGHWGNDSRLGVSGHAYLEQNAGEFENHGYTQLGYNPSGVGFIRVNGGRMTMAGGAFDPEADYSEIDYWEGRIELSRGGTGIMQIAGDGRFECPANGVDIGSFADNSQSGGMSVLTVQDNAYADVGWFDIGMRHNHFSAVNLNGGILRTGYFNHWTDFDETRATHVNFNGGTLRASQSEPGGLLRSTMKTFIWPRGAILDTDIYDVFITAPLSAPAGKGVESIPLTGNGYGYIAPPHVKLTGGGGIGATAVAYIDRVRGVVTNITVTSPGVGYTSAPDVSFSGGGGIGVWCASPVMRDNSSGGLTKLGTGSLHLQAANTYTGPTVIRQGTLFIEADGALPEDSAVVIEAGATLDLGGRTVTVPSVTINGGTVANGTLLSSSFIKDGDGTATLGWGSGIGFLSPGADAAKRATPGLWEGRLPGDHNITDPAPRDRVTLGTDQANSNFDYDGINAWPEHVTECYSGYIWNRGTADVTWTLFKNFDDTIALFIDGVSIPVLNGNQWNKIGIMNITLTPGPHAIDIRFGQAYGSGGPNSTDFDNGDTIGWPAGIALGIDFQGRGEKIMGNFIKFEDPGDGSLLTTGIGGWQGFDYAPLIAVGEGTLRLPATRPGLWEGTLLGERNVSGDNPKTAVRLTTAKAHTGAGWDEYTTAVYTGVIWNNTDDDVTWTFAKNFDDFFDIWIDDNNLTPDWQEWNKISLATATLTPGPHDFEVRFGQGSGGAGPAAYGWEGLGFGIDFSGRGEVNRANFIRAADAGDGLLFTLERPDGSYVNDLGGATVHIAPGAVFDGSGTIVTNVTFTGEGTVSNLTLAAGTVISPAGDTAIGTLAFSAVTFGAGSTYRVNAAGAATADTITSTGSLNLTNLTVVPADTPSADPEGKEYIIAHADGGFAGTKPALSGFAKKWNLRIKGNDLILTKVGGTLILLK